MIRLLLLKYLFFFSLAANARTIIVKNIDELNGADKKALPGDIIILQNGNWNNVTILLSCNGTNEKPITVKAQTAGKVLITGNSKLKLGGQFILVDGLYFNNGFAGRDNVISFRIDNKQLANNCRVTNTVINNFNNPKRMDENNWVGFYGKNNRIDHCSFIDKNNMGVLMAVLLDDERSRENYHSIDHNYFGRRLPLASNGGEIIRVGISQHCQYNSNTKINSNFFDQCDGEAEIISIKSCANEVKENIFKECQGAVVLRHGDDNTVGNNIFLGNDKEGTGGVRVINKGQWVVNNFFYKCRGTGFRSPLTIMNGIPNSPANRYVQVSDAIIANNVFIDCSPLSFCEGSDSERTLPPVNVFMFNNNFYNQRDTSIYTAFDDISKINFINNNVHEKFQQRTVNGFERTSFSLQKWDAIGWPVSTRTTTYQPIDSLQGASKKRLGHILPKTSGAVDPGSFKKINAETQAFSGANWFKHNKIPETRSSPLITCKTAEDIYKALDNNKPAVIQLTANEYHLARPFLITNSVQLIGNDTNTIKFISGNMLGCFLISKQGALHLKNLRVDGNGVQASNFICSDSNGYSEHYKLTIKNCSLQNFKKEQGCDNIFFAYKHTLADSIIIHNSSFINNNCNLLVMNDEKEDKGYYNAEKIIIGHNKFLNHSGSLLNIYRGGSDESTLGPDLVFSHNKNENCQSPGTTTPLISLTGVQVTRVFSNQFTNCNTGKALILYKDQVRANHYFEKNVLTSSGMIDTNRFVSERSNIIR